MRTVQLIPACWQREWRVLAVINFILGGAGTGFYFISWVTTFFNRSFSEHPTSVPYDLLSLSIVAFGLLCVAAETGRPSRGYYILSRLGKSWISMEVTAFIVFALAVFLSHIFRHWVFVVIAAGSSLCFMIAQGLIVYSARTVSRWHTAFIPLFFLSSGLASGTAIALLFGSLMAILYPLCVVFNLVIWLLYLRWHNMVPLQTAAEPPGLKRRFSNKILAIFFSHIIPLLIFILISQIKTQPEIKGMLRDNLAIAAGLSIIIGVSVQKFWIVISAAYTGKVALKF